MQQAGLGERGPRVSRLGLGCMGMTYSYGGRDEAEAVATLHRALERGVNFFDTADMYGPWTNEELLGRALRGRREEVVLASKFGQEIDAEGRLTRRVNGRPDYLRRALDASLRRLGVEYIDLYYQHRVDPEIPVEETWGALGEAVAQGKVRHLGISEAAPETVRRAHATHPITALQYEYSLFSREVETDGVLAAARELGLGFVAYSPLGRGILTGAIRQVSDLPSDDSRPNFPRFAGENLARNYAIVERLEAIKEAGGDDFTVTVDPNGRFYRLAS
jgi:aryl-alcohol dehydrogenase-like predicted oxidoreductase